ncbi:GNAT family N-acetyltransferase [Waterburya agarophytonicola]
MRQERSLDKDNQNIKIRLEEAQDYSNIFQLNSLAFGQENEAELIEKIRKSDRYIPELSLVAELDSKIVGHIIFSYIDLVDRETTLVLALAPIAVLPEYQNRGIGSLLITTGLEIAEKIQIPMVIVLGNPKFYNRFGFKPAINYGIKSPFDVGDEYFMVKFFNSDRHKYKGKVIYPITFNETN